MRSWLGVSYLYALLVAVGLGYFISRIPIQVTDSFMTMAALDKPMGDLLRDNLQDRAYFRPVLWVGLKAVHAASGGDYTRWYRAAQVVQAAIVVFLFVRLLQPRTASAAALLPLALGVLLGHHSFAWTVREAYPVNHFLVILLCCAAAANLAFATHRWWTDALAGALFVGAALTIESGLLVWVIFAAGYALGLRGVSRKGLALVTACLAGYFVLRIALGVSAPGLLLRESGFGFARLTGSELHARFGENPFGFYAYNVASSILGVLAAEPRDGVWRLVRSVVERAPDLPSIINVVSCMLATALLAWFAWTRRQRWLARDFDRRDRLVIMFAVVLAANAAICYAYTKDVIMSPAGFFLAAAVFAAASQLVDAAAARRVGPRVPVVAFVAILSTLWAVRMVGLHAALAETALDVREEWAYIDAWLARQGTQLDPRGLALKRRLQDDAVIRFPARPPVRDEWVVLFDTD